MGKVIVLLLQPHACFLEPAVFPLWKERNNQGRKLILIRSNEQGHCVCETLRRRECTLRQDCCSGKQQRIKPAVQMQLSHLHPTGLCCVRDTLTVVFPCRKSTLTSPRKHLVSACSSSKEIGQIKSHPAAANRDQLRVTHNNASNQSRKLSCSTLQNSVCRDP